MAKDFSHMEDSNRSSNPSIHDQVRALRDPARRQVLSGSAGAVLATAFAPWLAACGTSAAAVPRLGFKAVPPSRADSVVVPEGYVATVLAPWGEPVGLPGNMPVWRHDASNTAAEQAAQMGMHHDGLQFYPLEGSSRRGLLAINHEYGDDGLLHADGVATWSAEKTRKAKAAMGIAVIEVVLRDGQWQVVRPSAYARRLTADSVFALGGPAAGHPLMRTAADPDGRQVLGTLGNCGCGMTPWGTYLSGEENFMGYFRAPERPDAHQRRWGARRNPWVRWHESDPRFDLSQHPNEANRFGWIVEVDPFDPRSVPVKRTALGRAAHEGAWVAVTRDRRAVVYSGEDAAFECIYKFVSRAAIQPGGAAANRKLLDHGTLYVARFDADGLGRWLPLLQGQGPLTPANGFADQAEVLIKSRQASDLLGATRMDRPEWLAIDPHSRWVYCTLTNNEQRGGPSQPGVDAANPRANNTMGQIIRWHEDHDFDSLTFEWNHLLLAGDPANERPEAQGNIRGDSFSSPDGIAFDGRGLLWICTDMSNRAMHQGELARLGNNQLLACDIRSGEVRRFLTGPVGCELAGSAFSPDGTTLFVSVQHPGESPGDRSDPAAPSRYSSWPDQRPGGRPRSAVLAIRKRDGGVIGT